MSSLQDEICEEDKKQETVAKASAQDSSENSHPASVFDGSSITEEQSLKNHILTCEAKEEILKELGACLPAWVTRDQMLDLISMVGTDIIEAASNFYERETDFYRQVSASLTTSSDISQSVSTPSAAKSDAAGSVKFFSSKEHKLVPLKKEHKLSRTFQVKKSPKPGKRLRSISKNPKKKNKVESKLETVDTGGGSRQSRITSFFSKLLPTAPQGCGTGTESYKSIKEENLSSSPVDRKVE